MCLEDFSFIQETSGAFIFIGCMQEQYYPQHNENFTVVKESILLGVQAMYDLVKKYLS